MTNKQLGVLIISIFGAVVLGYMLFSGGLVRALDFRTEAEMRFDKATEEQEQVFNRSMDNAAARGIFRNQPLDRDPQPDDKSIEELDVELNAARQAQLSPEIKEMEKQAAEARREMCKRLGMKPDC